MSIDLPNRQEFAQAILADELGYVLYVLDSAMRPPYNWAAYLPKRLKPFYKAFTVALDKLNHAVGNPDRRANRGGMSGFAEVYFDKLIPDMMGKVATPQDFLEMWNFAVEWFPGQSVRKVQLVSYLREWGKERGWHLEPVNGQYGQMEVVVK